MALATLVGATTLSAHHGNDAEHKPAHKTIFAKDGAANHWFIELGDYATFLQAGQNNSTAFGDRLSYVNPTLSVGRWFSPYFATRLNLQGGELKENFDFGAFGRQQAKHKYVNGSLDFMFDVVNYFAPYKENRFFHLIPFVGVGAGYRFDPSNTTIYTGDEATRFSPLANVGLQLKFRLAKRIDFNLEGKLTANDYRLISYVRVDDAGKGEATTVRGGYLGSLGASLTFHLGKKKEFTPVVAQDDALIASLNSTLSALRAENAELAKRPTHCPEVEAPQVAGVAVGNVVYFRLNSAVVDANQMINIRNIAEYAKNNTETITLVGHADRQTGTPDYNYKLSQRRAEAVKKILVEKYGISADRIKASWEGDRVQPYAENVWNRVVIMNAE